MSNKLPRQAFLVLAVIAWADGKERLPQFAAKAAS
jgi:hypothetical protein